MPKATRWDERMNNPNHPIHQDRQGGGEWDHTVQDPFGNLDKNKQQGRVVPSIFPPPMAEKEDKSGEK